MAALLHIKPKLFSLWGTGRMHTRPEAAVKEQSFTNFSKVLPAYTSWGTSSESNGAGITKKHGRLFLASNFQTVCAILTEVSHSSDTTGLQHAPRSIMNLSRLRIFDTESVTDQITTLSYFWIHGVLILAFLRARLEDDSQGCQHEEVRGNVLLRGRHSLRNGSWDPEIWTTQTHDACNCLQKQKLQLLGVFFSY